MLQAKTDSTELLRRIFLCVFFSFLKLFFLVVYVRTKAAILQTVKQHKGGQKLWGRWGGGGHPDTAEVAIDGTLNGKQANKDRLTFSAEPQMDRQTDFKLLQNEPRPGLLCRSNFLPSSSQQRRIALCDVRVNAAEPIVLRGAA